MTFDTDVLIWFFRGDRAAARLIDSEPDRATSIVSLMELIQRAKSKREAAAIRRFLRDFEFAVLPISEPISYLAAALIEEHARPDGLQVADALIAATVRDRGDTLATGNVRHFRQVARLDLKAFRPSGDRPKI